jgi:hypothetical protein
VQWNPEEWWAGSDAFIIGGGDSLRSFDWARLFGRKTIGCNDAYRLGPDVCSACIFGDLRWFQIHRKSLEAYANQSPVFTNQPSLHTGQGVPWLRTLRRESGGLHTRALGWGGNTGCAAINLALLLGARRVFLLGFDLKIGKGGKTNWHDANISKPTEASYVRFHKGFVDMANDLPRVFPGREVYNCGPDSNLRAFPMMDLEEALCGSVAVCS